MKNHVVKIIAFVLCGLFALQSCKKEENTPKDNLTVREAVHSSGAMSIPVKIGTPLQLNLAITPGNRTVQDATYQNKHPEIATFSSTGLVTGVAVGKDTVTITSGDLKVWYVVNVTK